MEPLNFTPLKLPPTTPRVVSRRSSTIPLLVSAFAFVGVFGYLIYYLMQNSFIIPFTSKAAVPTPTIAVFSPPTTPTAAPTKALSTVESIEQELTNFESTIEAEPTDVQAPEIILDF